jgi:hypothetical protein
MGLVKRGLHHLFVQGAEQQLSQGISVIRRQVDKGDSDGSATYHNCDTSPTPRGVLEFRAQYVDQFPVNRTFLKWEQRTRLVPLVERMLPLHERLAEARIESERTVIQHQIDATDQQIDRLVNDLYDLTDEEIEIVERESRQGG